MNREIEQAAKAYAENKSSSPVFKEAHEKDFTAGATSDAAKEYWFEKFKEEISPETIIGDAFEAGIKHQKELKNGGVLTKTPNKEQYIKQVINDQE